jgi:hypothetical protein
MRFNQGRCCGERQGEKQSLSQKRSEDFIFGIDVKARGAPSRKAV